MPDFEYEELLPVGHHDDTPYRLLTTDGVTTIDVGGRRFLQVEPEALTALTKQAMFDIAHLLRPGHLQQLRHILDDPEASANDRFVAFELLKNASIAAGGVLPGCQDTGTAIVMGKKGERVITDADDERWIAKGVFHTYDEANLRFSQMAPLTMWDEVNTRTNLPAQIELYAVPGDEYHFLFMAKGGGSANKSYLFQETKALLNPASLMKFLDEKLRGLGTAACPPYHLAVVIGGTSAEHTLKVAKLASARYLDSMPTSGNALGRGFRDVDLEQEVLELTRQFGIGAQFGGKYFCHDVRVIRLPRHGASCPVGLAVSCSADRNALAKITADGVFLEQLETDPARYLPETSSEALGGDVVAIDLTRPMGEIRSQLSKYPVKTRLSLTGPMVVARDIAHAKIKERLDAGEPMPAYLRVLRRSGQDARGLRIGFVRPHHCRPHGQLRGSVAGGGRELRDAGQGQPLEGRDRRLLPARRLLPRLDRRARRPPGAGLHHQGGGARVRRARHGSGLEDRGAGLPGVHRGRRQGQRLLRTGERAGAAGPPAPLTQSTSPSASTTCTEAARRAGSHPAAAPATAAKPT